MRMRHSLAQLEREFEQEAARERYRRQHLQRSAAERSRVRKRAKIEHSQRLRFMLLAAAIVFTAVAVTVGMFQTLSWLIG
jgi:hypothetical protein